MCVTMQQQPAALLGEHACAVRTSLLPRRRRLSGKPHGVALPTMPEARCAPARAAGTAHAGAVRRRAGDAHAQRGRAPRARERRARRRRALRRRRRPPARRALRLRAAPQPVDAATRQTRGRALRPCMLCAPPSACNLPTEQAWQAVASVPAQPQADPRAAHPGYKFEHNRSVRADLGGRPARAAGAGGDRGPGALHAPCGRPRAGGQEPGAPARSCPAAAQRRCTVRPWRLAACTSRATSAARQRGARSAR